MTARLQSQQNPAVVCPVSQCYFAARSKSSGKNIRWVLKTDITSVSVVKTNMPGDDRQFVLFGH